MNRKQITAIIAAGAAGLAAAITLTLPATASAYTPDQLPNMGYRVIETNLGNNCHDWQASGYGHSADLGSDCDPGFQQALDDFVNSSYPPPPTTAPTTTAATTTDATTTAPQDTTTADTATTPTQTTPQATDPATTEPVSAPAPPASAPVTPTCDVQCQIASLQAQLDALRGELTRLEQILQTWPSLDPGILAELMALQG